jgi:hypothetical protein
VRRAESNLIVETLGGRCVSLPQSVIRCSILRVYESEVKMGGSLFVSVLIASTIVATVAVDDVVRVPLRMRQLSSPPHRQRPLLGRYSDDGGRDVPLVNFMDTQVGDPS